MPYTMQGYMNAWARALFGILIGFLVMSVFNSWFLAVVCWAFFFFIPMQNQNAENIVNRCVFGVLIWIILLWAFGGGGSNFSGAGLGLDTGVGTLWTTLANITLLAFVGLSIAAGRTGKSMFYVFAFLALALTVLFSNVWDWNTSAIIFMAVWTISAVVGLTTDPQTKASIGVFMLLVCLAMYSIGVGTNDVGTAFFGDWWPAVHNAWSSISTPLFDAIKPLWSTVGNAWSMFTNPVGYATQLMNGSYAPNSLGETGVHGVDITQFTVEKAFVNQPFFITAILKNSGASGARNVKASLEIDPTRLHVYSGPASTTGLRNIADIGIGAAESIKDMGPMDRIGIQQLTFKNDRGVSCTMVNKYELRKKVIPLRLTTTYDYESDSHVPIEFIRQDEWERLSLQNKLVQKDAQSEYSSAPARFPIGTAGLKQPLIANFQEFNIGLRLDAEAFNSQIEKVSKVELRYPAEFKLKECSPKQTDITPKGTVVWLDLPGKGTKILFCTFEKLSLAAMGSAPTKTYEVTAHAEYSVSNWRSADLTLEFGGVCCSSEDCLSSQVCSDCTCMPAGTKASTPACPQSNWGPKPDCSAAGEGAACYASCPDGTKDDNSYACSDTTLKCCVKSGTGTVPDSLKDMKGTADFCAKLKAQTVVRCSLGWGGCTADDECIKPTPVTTSGFVWLNDDIKCKNAGDSIKACCSEGLSDTQCKAAFDEWKSSGDYTKILNAVNNAA